MLISLETVLDGDRTGDRSSYGRGLTVGLDWPRFGVGYDRQLINTRAPIGYWSWVVSQSELTLASMISVIRHCLKQLWSVFVAHTFAALTLTAAAPQGQVCVFSVSAEACPALDGRGAHSLLTSISRHIVR